MPQKYIPCLGLVDGRITEAKHRLNEGKLYVAIKALPENKKAELLTMTWEEIFELAALDDSVRATVKFGDPAWDHFANSAYQMLRLAEIMEIRDQYKHQIEEILL